MAKRGKSERTAEQILKAAAEAFLSDGYRDTSLDDVAAAAGVTKPTVYSHFGSKQGVLLALVQLQVSANANALSTSLQPTGNTAADLTRFGELFLSRVMCEKSARWRRLALSQSAEHPEIGKTISKRVRRVSSK